MEMKKHDLSSCQMARSSRFGLKKGHSCYQTFQLGISSFQTQFITDQHFCVFSCFLGIMVSNRLFNQVSEKIRTGATEILFGGVEGEQLPQCCDIS